MLDFQVAGVDVRFESKQRAVIEYLQYREVPSEIKRKVWFIPAFLHTIVVTMFFLSLVFEGCHVQGNLPLLLNLVHSWL